MFSRAPSRGSVGLFVLALCFGGIGSTATAGEPAFVVEEALAFTYPSVGSNADHLSFSVFSKEGVISGVRVPVIAIKDPDGRLLSSEAGTAALEKGATEVSSTGGQVVLSLKPAFFVQPGDYKAVLRLEGTAGAAAIRLPVTVTLRHPAAEINLDELKDRTVELQRPCPGAAASGTLRFPLIETTGKAGLADLQIHTQSVQVKGSMVVTPGTVTIRPVVAAPAGSPGKTAPAVKVTVPAGGRQDLDVTFADVRRPGELTTRLVITSPSLPSSRSLLINLTVADAPYVPLLVIVLGVLGGFAVQFFTQDWRPRAVNSMAIVRLRAEVTRLRPLLAAPGKREQLDVIWNRLMSAEEKNGNGDTAGAKADLAEAERQLQALRTQQATDRTKVIGDTRSLKSQVERSRDELLDLTAEDRTNLDAVLGALREVEELLWNDRVDDASDAYHGAETRFQDFRLKRLERDRDRLFNLFQEAVSEAQVAADDAAKTQIDQRFTELNALMAARKLDEAQQHLEAIATHVNQFRAAHLPRRARDADAASAALLQAPPAAAAAPAVSIQVDESLTTDASGRLELLDPGGLTQDGDLFQWDFGDGSGVAEMGRRVTHPFTQPGPYLVKLQVLRGDHGEQVVQAARQIQVQPGKAWKQQAAIRSQIQLGDYLLIGLAVLLATLSGMQSLYVDKPFGKPNDYILAFFWGFGIEKTLQGFAAVLQKLRPA